MIVDLFAVTRADNKIRLINWSGRIFGQTESLFLMLENGL